MIIKVPNCYDQKYLFNNIFPNTLLASGTSVLQIGARSLGAIGMFQGFQSHGYTTFHVLEIWPKNIQWCQKQPMIQKAILGDVRKINQYTELLDTYDIIVHWHGPEHLKKNEMADTVDKVLAKCKIAFIIGAPWGKWEQSELGGNKYEQHLSHWYPEELEKLGFDVYTIGPGPNKKKPLIGIMYK